MIREEREKEHDGREANGTQAHNGPMTGSRLLAAEEQLDEDLGDDDLPQHLVCCHIALLSSEKTLFVLITFCNRTVNICPK